MSTSIMKWKPLRVEVLMWGLILLGMLTQLTGAIMMEENSNSQKSSMPFSNQQPTQTFPNNQQTLLTQTYPSNRLLQRFRNNPTDATTHLTDQIRLLSVCQITNCLYCITTKSDQFCIVCAYPYQPNSLLSQCTIPNTNNTTPITPNCTITNCKACQSITLGIIKQQICIQCITGYRFLILQGSCYPKSQLNDSSEIISYGTYYYLCQEGCKSCQPSTTIQICYTCLDGYQMVSTTNFCIKCKGFCKTCSFDDTALCLTCFPGYVLQNNNTCVQCGSEHCYTCDPPDPNKCTSCIPGYFLNNNQCLDCQSSCENCENSTVQCPTCQLGTYFYSSTSNSSSYCLSCIYGCMNCSNITHCTKCYPGYFLNSTNQCEACQANCWNCTSASDCQQCLVGYNLFNNKCIMPKDNCILMNQDGTCKFCKSNYSEINGDCTFNNNDTSIVTMACKYGMFAQSYWCYFCNNTFSNCQQCNSGLCLKCFGGYYLQTNTYKCVKCEISGCQVCQSSKVCSQCQDGYYLQQFLQNQSILSNGVCYTCDANCKTCNYNPKYCTTCYPGYTLNQQRVCEASNNSLQIKIKLDFDYFTHLEIVQEIKSTLLTMTNHLNSTSPQANIKILSIRSGSTIIIFEVYEENAYDLNAKFQILATNLVNGSTIGGVTIISVQFSQPLPSPSPSQTTNSLGIILGTVLGGVGLIIIVVIICCCCCCKNKKQNQDKNEKKPSSEGETVDENEQEHQTPKSLNHNNEIQKNKIKNEQDNKSEEKINDSKYNPYKNYL